MAITTTTHIGLQGWSLLRQFHLNVPLLKLTSSRLIEAYVGIICACMPACAAVFRQPCPGYFILPSFDPLKSWFSKMSARLVSNKSTSQGLELPVSEKAESNMRVSQESGVGSGSGLVGLNAASNLSRNTPW